MIKKRLLTPGPVDIPPSVLAISAQPAPHHRTPEYRHALKNVQDRLQGVFLTKNRILPFSSSGTGAMEAAMVNLVAPDETVLIASGGAFGDRWIELAKTYGIDAIPLQVEWGTGVDPEQVRVALKQSSKPVKAVFTTLSETSTGVDHPVEAIGSVCRQYGALFVVDAVSGLGAAPFKTDEWGVDVVVAGSQKALMVPPGLALVSVSEKAWKAIGSNARPRYYFDLERAKKTWEKESLPDTPFTSTITLILQLQEALRMILEEGLEPIWARHARYAELIRKAMGAMGLTLFAKSHASQVLTSVNVPEGVDGKKLVKIIRDEYGISLAGGQKHLEGKIFRIGNVGYLDQFDLVSGVTAVELALDQLGYAVPFGRAHHAIQEHLTGKSLSRR